MIKSINKLLLILVLVLIVNFMPSKASASYQYSLGNNQYSQPITLYVDMSPEAQSLSGKIYTGQRVGVSLWVTGLYCGPDVCSPYAPYLDARLGNSGYYPSSETIRYDFNNGTMYYPNGNQYDSDFYALAINGHNLMKFIAPGGLSNTLYIYFYKYNTNDTIQFAIPLYSFLPTVDVNAYDLTTGTPVLIPKTNNVTNAITPGTKIRLYWTIASGGSNNLGFNCKKPDNSWAGVNVYSGWYPSSTTTIDAPSTSPNYSFACTTNPDFVNITINKLYNVRTTSVDVLMHLNYGGGSYPTEYGVIWSSNRPDIVVGGSGVNKKVISNSQGLLYDLSTTLNLYNPVNGSGSYLGASYWIRGYIYNQFDGYTYGTVRQVTLKTS